MQGAYKKIVEIKEASNFSSNSENSALISVASGGTLTINGKGSSYNTITASTAASVINSAGTVKISKLKLDNTDASGIGITNNGTLTVESNASVTPQGIGIVNSGNLTVSGTVSGMSTNGIGVKSTGGKIEVTGGAINGKKIAAQIDAGEFTLNSGTVQNSAEGADAALQLERS